MGLYIQNLRNFTQATWTHQNVCEDVEIVPGFIGGNVTDLQLQVLYGTGREGLVVPAAVAEGTGNSITLLQRRTHCNKQS